MPDMFLKFHDIPGESLDEKHPGEIEIKQWEWESSANVSWERNQGGQCTHTTYGAIKVQKYVDSASAALLRCCLTGKHIRHATITCRKNDGDRKVNYLILELKDLMVRSVKWAGSGEDNDLPEAVELECAEFVNHYALQEDAGDPQGKTSFGYNIQTHVVG